MVTLVKCACGFESSPREFTYIGVQDLGDGEFAALANCPRCHSIVCTDVWTDWSTCWACGDPILGTCGDPKIVKGPGCVMHADCSRGKLRRRKSRPDPRELAPIGALSVQAACEVTS